MVRASPPNSNLPGIEFQSIPTDALFYFSFLLHDVVKLLIGYILCTLTVKNVRKWENILIVETDKKDCVGSLLTSFKQTSCIDKISLSLSIGWTSSVVRASPPNSNLPGIEFQSIPTVALFYFCFLLHNVVKLLVGYILCTLTVENVRKWGKHFNSKKGERKSAYNLY